MTPRNVNLHPENYLPDSLYSTTFDVVVIGSGPVGRQVASKAQNARLATVIVEDELRGVIVLIGHALLRPGEALAAARQVGGARRLIASDRLVDVQGVFEGRDKITHRRNDEAILNMSLAQKCTVVRGRGSLISEKRALVKNANGQEKTLSAQHAVVIATGSELIQIRA
ncbi:uncharacterized protein Z518_00518 [Rhinocladiella mackenziei CBS 650.93]|uniref:FAD/NAD(P)-binding domain-containing protein n=1 Tax=Rhinocladiella mackenziei CBS 650.93 TaxID=1442369 RepID=A0A0D2HFH6_9EURO|nr:uncharacterized protein Z518_00518 [Rhinocladiella mackenziei CBS 650.93]KIX09438.1 hypothetical protein Z518_00518 [Rhinocladiella mackenziei CBS 650.93]